jgi:hypothetical protein
VTSTHLALVVESPKVSPRTITEVAAAVQRQLTRDLAPVWNVQATIDAFASLDHVPPGYWPIIVRDDLPGIENIGMHLDRAGQPFALVELSPTWSLTVSHEALEMVIDPWGNRTVPGGSPRRGQGLVEILVEICDPVGGARSAYTVNGYLVSDFYTPSFFDPVGVAGVRYSFTGALRRPRQVLPGGYLSWRDPATDEWWQCDRIRREQLSFTNLGRLDEDGRPLRERVDERSPMLELYTGAAADDPALRNAYERRASTRAAAQANAAAVRGRLADLGLR